MLVEITHVRYGSTPKTEQTISHYKWMELNGPSAGESDKQSMVASVEAGARAFVRSDSKFVAVEVVNAFPKYLRGLGDGIQVNNLTNLPEF